MTHGDNGTQNCVCSNRCRRHARKPLTLPDYGREHRRLRRALLAAYIPGLTTCWRCGKPITTLRTRDIHLGHDDDNPSIWRGLEHATCNIEAGARRGAAITNAKLGTGHARKMAIRRTATRSRNW